MMTQIHAIVASEIASEIVVYKSSIVRLEKELKEAKARLLKLEAQEKCKEHDFVPLGGGMQSLCDVCSKCDRAYYY